MKPQNLTDAGVIREAILALSRRAREGELTVRARKSLENELRDAAFELADLLTALDPIQEPVALFDPSNPKVIGRIVALALVAQKRHPLSAVAKMYGSGVYAIYYNGSYPAYAAISGTETPVYVGQAAPSFNGARTPRDQGPRLAARLNEHRKNIIRAASTLSIEDFECRLLVVQSGWEGSAEDYLIHLFKPVWNSETGLVYGLGKHGDAATTRANKRSPWDTLHPGRAWAAGSDSDAKAVEQIVSELETHFAIHPAFAKLDEVLSSFLDELRQI